ncbi:hypothetical protein DRN69_07290 [Candidatus Pacearchaeota archaeon]|nr:MAG: hypothetical protein DRN69_07290 [Candidatus Pacearchaeota archaeon]
MAPGKWNDTHYTAEEIRRAYENTDWSNKDVISLILDHADKPLSVHDWVGWVKNVRMEGDNLVGDLELYDDNVITKLVKAKAKFGISPRVKGIEHNGELRNFTFENFSIVTNPAVKKAYINLSEKKLKGGKKMAEKELQETEESVETEQPEEEQNEQSTEEASKEEASEQPQETTKEMAKKKKAKKKKYPYPYDEELSDEELFEIVTNSEWTDFVKKMKKKYPKMTFKDIAKAFKKSKEASEELEQLSDEELIEKINQLTEILRRRKKYKEPEEEMSQTEKKLSQEIEELKKRLDAPNSIQAVETQTKELAATPYDRDERHYSKGVLAMADFVKKVAGTGQSYTIR